MLVFFGPAPRMLAPFGPVFRQVCPTTPAHYAAGASCFGGFFYKPEGSVSAQLFGELHALQHCADCSVIGFLGICGAPESHHYKLVGHTGFNQ